MSLWGWMAFYKPTPVGLAALSGIPAFAPAKPKIETRPGMTLLTLAGHTGMVSNVSFNSDWTRLATASWDKTIKVWDAKSAKELLTLAGHTEPVRRVTFSPDGMWLASASADKSVKLWDAFGGKEQRTLTGHTAAVVSVAFSPDGKRLASVSDDKTVKVWNVSTGRELLNLAGHTTPINAVAFSPDGQRLASAETNVKVWDVRSGQELVTLKGHTAIVGALAFRSDGQQLATGGFDTTVKLWDINSGKESQTLRGHQSMVQGLAYRADGSGLFSLGVDRKLKEWDLASGKLRRTIQSASSVSGLTLSSDGKRIAATGMMGAVEIWNELLDQPAPAHSGHAGAVMSVAFSPDSQWIASGSADQTIKLWSAATGQEKQTLKDHAGTVSAVAFRADDKSLVTVVSGFGQKGQAKVWDLGSGLDTHKFAVDFTGIIAMNAEGTRLASAFPDYSVKVWDLENERELSALKGHSGFLSSLALSRDGKWMASAGRVLGKPGAADYLTKPGEIRVWNISTGQESRLLGGQTAQVEGVAISPDGKRLASSHHDTPVIRNGAVYLRSILKLWDAQSGQELHAHNKTAAVASRHLLFSRDGKHLAAANSPAGNDITLFDAATGQELRTLKGHTQAVSSLDFSPDGKRLASASNDETVKVWDTTTGRELLMLGVPAQ
jgi:WD40 repeat protein